MIPLLKIGSTKIPSGPEGLINEKNSISAFGILHRRDCIFDKRTFGGECEWKQYVQETMRTMP